MPFDIYRFRTTLAYKIELSCQVTSNLNRHFVILNYEPRFLALIFLNFFPNLFNSAAGNTE